MHQDQEVSSEHHNCQLAIYPYIVIRLSPAFYHYILLPHLPSEQLFDIARTQVRFNRIRCCLVLGPEKAFYFEVTGKETESSSVPRGGVITVDRLKPCIVIEDNEDLMTRRAILEKAGKRGGFAMGDLTKGGRDATSTELETLSGFQDDGVPKGLIRCSTCGQWRGTCLDPNPMFKGKVMQVNCTCQNDNRCAFCGELLDAWKLNANFYDPKSRQIWHVPGFSALKHRCKKEYRSKLTLATELTDQQGKPGSEVNC